jgi:hypothetical protein
MNIRSCWAAVLVLVPVGCTSYPMADFLDWAHPARMPKGDGPAYGGVEPAGTPGEVPPPPPVPGAPAAAPPPPVWPEGPPAASRTTPELPNWGAQRP